MTAKHAAREITAFLAGDRAETLCVMGPLGVGKTFAWKQYLAETALKSPITRNYAYASLFGLNSLDELRHAIYENTVPASNAGATATWDTLASVWANAKTGVRKVRSALGVASGMLTIAGVNFGAVGDLIARSSFLLVRDQIICLDDLERAGEGLAAKDVLGLISFLKEERNCSVALLLNDGALKPCEREDMQRLLKKGYRCRVGICPDAGRGRPDSLEGRRRWRCPAALSRGSPRDHEHPRDPQDRRTDRERSRDTGRQAEGDCRQGHHLGRTGGMVGIRTRSSAVARKSKILRPACGRARTRARRWRRRCSAENITWRRQLARLGFSYQDELDGIIFDGAARGYFDEDAILTLVGELEGELKGHVASRELFSGLG